MDQAAVHVFSRGDRSLVMASDLETIYVATYDYDGTGKYGHVWVTTNAQAPVPSWTQLTESPAIVEEMVIVNDHLYAACGSQGVYRAALPVTAATQWEQLNGDFIDTTQSYWDSIAGYPSGTTDIVIACCDNPANIQLADIPPTGQPWWHYASDPNYHDWLGGQQWTNGHVVVATSPADGVHLYVTGDNGFYRSEDAGRTWTIAINGMPLFAGRSVAVDPANPAHIVFGDSDWDSWDIADGTGYGGRTTPVPAGSLEGYALAFDPDPAAPSGTDTLFLAAGKKYTNANGFVYARTSAEPPTAWTDTALSGKVGIGFDAPIGLTVVRDDAAPSNQYVLAAVEGSGMYLMTNGSAWKQVSNVIAAEKQSTEYMPFASLYGSTTYSKYVYVLDRASGVYRSADFGQSWTTNPIYACNSNSDSRTGFLALNPASGDELWVSNLSGLFKIEGASTFAGGTPTPVPLPNGMLPGAVACAADGTVYCLGLGAAGNPDAVLFRSVNGGADWQDVSGPGPGIASNACQPQNMVVAPNGLIYIANGGDIVAYGNPAAGWLPQGEDLHTGSAEHTSAATQVATSTAPVTATGQISMGDWLMLVVALET